MIFSECRLVAMALALGASYREFESRHSDQLVMFLIISERYVGQSLLVLSSYKSAADILAWNEGARGSSPLS